MHRPSTPFLALGLLALLATACGDDGTASESTTTVAAEASTTTTAPADTTTTEAAAPLRILVTNDDGVAAPGIDQLVTALQALPDVELVIVAPAENQSGSGDRVSEAPPAASDATTLSGVAAIAVAGTPADAVTHALDVVLADDPPDVVVSGVNQGQNVGPVVDLSGTVGAARTAARRGIPALAVSQALAEPVAFEVGAALAADWVTEHRDAIQSGSHPTDTIESINAPSCAGTGEPRGLVEVDALPQLGDRELFPPSNCASTLADPADDLEALANGFASLSVLGILPTPGPDFG